MDKKLEKYLKQLKSGAEINLISKMIEMGVEIEIISSGDKMLRARFEGREKILISNRLDFDTLDKIRLSTNKNASKLIFKEANLETPKGIIASSFSEAKIKIEESGIKFPLVAKPLKGSDSRGVFLGIDNFEDLKNIFRKGDFNESNKFLVEEFFAGNNFRLLVLGGEFIACVQRTSANVIGDGESTIRKLIENKNKNSISGHKIIVDNALEKNLVDQGFNLETVLRQKQRVYLRKIESVSTGGDSIDKTNQVSEFFKDIARKATKAIGLQRAGVDIITDDISKDNCEYKVIEINSKPGLTIHEKPLVQGETHQVTKKFIEAYFKRD